MYVMAVGVLCAPPGVEQMSDQQKSPQVGEEFHQRERGIVGMDTQAHPGGSSVRRGVQFRVERALHESSKTNQPGSGINRETTTSKKQRPDRKQKGDFALVDLLEHHEEKGEKDPDFYYGVGKRLAPTKGSSP